MSIDDHFHITERRYEPNEIARVWRQAEITASINGKTPVACVKGPEWRGTLVIVREEDLPKLVQAKTPPQRRKASA